MPQKHGLRHENYQRYRGYCARRIERIRKSLKFMHSYKCAPKRAAKFVARNVSAELVGDLRFLQIVVFEVERNWAYAMQMKFETIDLPLSRKKFHMRQKLRRAVKCALFLESLADGNQLVHRITHLETKSYVSFICGSLELELKNWKGAVDAFDRARAGYAELFGQVKGNELDETYAAKCRDVENLLNLCQAQSGDANVLLSTVSSVNLNASEDERKLPLEQGVIKAAPGNTKQKKRLRLAMEPKPLKPFFFDLALNFIKPSDQSSS
uniref:Signal recognition particle subunit SRP68 n=1 Tax=Globodera rostochiensis TaxID=31243 RepID=A0A914HDZ8_GLORO